MKKILLTYFFLNLFLFSVYAEHEKEVHVKNVRGEYFMTSDMDVSMKMAQQSAREDAKHKALVKVCGERVNVWDQVEGSSAGETFNSLSMVQVDGEIVDFDVVKEGYDKNPLRETELMFYCIAHVTVKKGIEPDPDFNATVTGIKTSYIADEQLTFKIKAYRDAYLKVFIFENAELGYRLYPNEFEKPFKLTAGQEYTFPINSDYPVYTDKELETDRLVFIFTKSERPYYDETTSRKEIEMWMARIPNDQKFVYYTSINILKK